jgi:hypothetical protein
LAISHPKYMDTPRKPDIEDTIPKPIPSSDHSTQNSSFLKNALMIAAGGALAAIVVFGVYYTFKRVQVEDVDRAKLFIKSELKRLRNPYLTSDGAMRKKDFFDLIMLV